MVVEFRFDGGRYGSTCGVNVEVAAVTAISVLSARFIAELAFGLLFVFFFFFRIMCLFIKENERMDWVQGMVQPKRQFRT